jgi:hypothetical protein
VLSSRVFICVWLLIVFWYLLLLGEDEETKKEKQKAAIEAAFKGLLKGTVVENGDSDSQDSDDG